ncbi:hypothetical protein HYC85_028154 [Camellia sinensis]|uniref:FBD domain-containing protein n=1 Tax=Camellia sinensis TaxID=4442 RepID=A0A7J7FUB5_CAMSI|nr:hypothetical protein HYC85_028154 [Camellia sinensis]
MIREQFSADLEIESPDYLTKSFITFSLSYPLKEAVATRVLSKTWCRIPPVQHLNFATECSIVYKLTNNMEETSHAETQDIDVKPFLDFVDQSLQGFCKQQESIRAFSLHMHFYCHKYDAPFINKWIKLTADNDFQVICIRIENGFYDPPRFILPHTIFTSKLLTVLSLVSCELKDYSLRDTARLENVVIEDGCRFDSTDWIHRIKIEAQSLRTFYFRRGYRKDPQLDLKCCKNLEILSLDALREFIGTQSHNEVLSLKLLHNSKATFDLQELRGITIPPMRGVKHLKLKLKYDYRSWPSEALSLKFKLQCRKGVRNNCCKSTEIKGWRHDLKEVKIEEFIGTKKGMPLAQRKIITNADPHQNFYFKKEKLAHHYTNFNIQPYLERELIRNLYIYIYICETEKVIPMGRDQRLTAND